MLLSAVGKSFLRPTKKNRKIQQYSKRNDISRIRDEVEKAKDLAFPDNALVGDQKIKKKQR